MTIAFAALYAYLGWLLYILVMGVYRAHLCRRLSGVTKALLLPVVVVALLSDCLGNVVIATALFLDPPREALFTDRLKRYKAESFGWRGAVADLICEHLLDVFDPTGDHC